MAFSSRSYVKIAQVIKKIIKRRAPLVGPVDNYFINLLKPQVLR